MTQHTIAELTRDYTAALEAESAALKATRDEFSREVMNAQFATRYALRRLEAAQDREARREETSELTASEIVARAYERQ
jgi:hypothetical protein